MGYWLFNTKLIGNGIDYEFVGVHEMIYKSMIECGLDMYECSDIVLSGGNAEFDCWFEPNGGAARLTYEMNKLLRNNDDIVIDGYVRKYGVKSGAMSKDVVNIVDKYSQPLRPCNIICPPRKRMSAWMGGNLLASSSNFLDDICISKEEYQEYGNKIVHRKCF